jgi:hypothetical protein
MNAVMEMARSAAHGVEQFTAAQMAYFVHLRKTFIADQAGIGVGSFLGVILAVLVLVIGVSLSGTVLTEAASVLGHTNIASFPLVATVITFLPVVYIAGLFGLAGGIAAIGIRTGR